MSVPSGLSSLVSPWHCSWRSDRRASSVRRARCCSMRAEHPLAGVPAEPGVPKPDPVLMIDSLTRSFGGLRAVDVAHLEFQRRCITGLIGPNGAGKTTLFNLLTGFDRPNTGVWSLDGKPLRGLPAHRVAQNGMVRTFQLTKALSRLTVMDNM